MAAGSPIGLLLTLTQADGGGDGEVCGTPIGLLLTLTHCIGEEPEPEVTATAQPDPGGLPNRLAHLRAVEHALEEQRARQRAIEQPVVETRKVIAEPVVEQPKPGPKLTPATPLAPILVGKAVMGLQLPSLTAQVQSLEADDEEALIAILLAIKGS